HRDSAVPAGAVKVGVLGVLATATIAAPLAAAASGIDETAPQGETAAQAVAPAAPAAEAQAPAPVALPSAETAEAAVEARADDTDADRSEARTSPVSDDSEAEDAESEDQASEEADGTGIEVSVPEPVEEAEVAAPVGDDGYLRPVSGPITSGYGGRMPPVLRSFKGH